MPARLAKGSACLTDTTKPTNLANPTPSPKPYSCYGRLDAIPATLASHAFPANAAIPAVAATLASTPATWRECTPASAAITAPAISAVAATQGGGTGSSAAGSLRRRLVGQVPLCQWLRSHSLGF